MPRAIIADDHDVIIFGLTELLQSLGFEVIASFKSGGELLREIQALQADLLILDFYMPGFNVETLKDLASNNSHLKIIVFTACEDPNILKQLASLPLQGLVPKTVDKDELKFAIQTVLKGKKFIAPDLIELVLTGNQNLSHVNGSFSKLSPREIEILKYLAEGYSNREIAKLLNLSSRTVDSHRTNILKKLRLKNNQELVKLAIKHNLISL